MVNRNSYGSIITSGASPYGSHPGAKPRQHASQVPTTKSPLTGTHYPSLPPSGYAHSPEISRRVRRNFDRQVAAELTAAGIKSPSPETQLGIYQPPAAEQQAPAQSEPNSDARVA